MMSKGEHRVLYVLPRTLRARASSTHARSGGTLSHSELVTNGAHCRRVHKLKVGRHETEGTP
jgi:hypothetical protein